MQCNNAHIHVSKNLLIIRDLYIISIAIVRAWAR